MKNKTTGYLAAQAAYSAYKRAREQPASAGSGVPPRPTESSPESEVPASFRKFAATELYCPTCKRAMPVRPKLLLHLPGGDLTDYVCHRCGTSLGTHQGK